MSQPKTNKLPLEAFLTIAKKLGCTLEEQKGFWKITGLNQGRVVYPARQKNVGRIDLSGFTHVAGVAHRKSPTKRVLQELDLTKEPVAILKDFFNVLRDGLMTDSPNARSIDSAKDSEVVVEGLDDMIAAACADLEVEPTEETTEEPAADAQ